MMKNKKFWIAGIVIVVIAIAVFLISRNKSSQGSVQTQTSTVDYGTIVTSISGSGSLSSQSQADVSAPGYGIIDKIYVKNGDEVKAGQTLFHFKSLASASDVIKAQANLSSLNSSLINARLALQDAITDEQILSKKASSSELALESAKIDAKKDLETANKAVIDSANTQEKASTDLDIISAQSAQKSSALALDSAKIKSQQAVIDAQNDYTQAKQYADSAIFKKQSAQYSYNAAQANLASSSIALQEVTSRTITAPISGKVSNLGIIENAIVGSSSSSSDSDSDSSSSVSILSISNSESLEVVIAVNEVDISSIKEDQIATLTFDAIPDKTYTGHVSNIDYIGTTTQGVTTYDVQIILDKTDEAMRPGMSASASIMTERKDNVLLVPSSAVQTQNGQSVVNVIRNGQTTAVTVTTGISNDVETEITGGLEKGDTIVTTQASTTTGSAFSRSSGIFGGIGGGTTRVFTGGGGPGR